MSTRTNRLARLALVGALTVGTAVAVTGSVPVTGAEVGPTDDFQVSQVTPTPAESHLAYNAADEEYLVVWSSVDASLESRIWGRIIDATTGAGVTDEFLIAEINPGDPTTGYLEPDVAWNSTDNEYAVVFAGDHFVDTGLIVTTFEIYAQRVSAAGAMVGGLVRVSDLGSDDTDGNFDANQPAIAYNPTANQYLVVFDGDDDTAPLANGHDEIFGQLLAADLTVPIGAGNDVQLSDMGADGDGSADARGPAVAWDGTDYLVVWEGDDDSVTFEIFGQYVNPDGTESGTDFLISTDTANDEAYDADVATNPATGDAFVVWEHDDGVGNDFEIEGTIVNGTPGTSFPVSETGDATYNVETPAVAYQPGSATFSIVWTGEHTGITAAGEFEVFHTVRNAAGTEVEPVERISTMGVDGVASTAVRHSDIAAGPATSSGVVWSGEDVPGAPQVWGQLVSLEADLEIVSKTLTSATPATVGDPVVYLITYINNGPADAFGVRITDPIPADVTINDVASTGATLIPVVGENLAWDIASLPSGTGGTITLTGVLAATAVDGATIDNTATIGTGPLGGDDDGTNDSKTASLTVDNPPTVTIDQAVGQPDPTKTSPIDFDVVFSEDVTGFTDGDVVLGGTAGATTVVVTPVTGSTYTVSVSGMTADGTVTASIGAGAANDTGPSTYPSAASTSSDNEVTYDTTAPTVTVEQAGAQLDPTNSTPINFTATFTEAMVGFDDGDVTVGGTAGATTAVVTGGPAVFNIAVSGMTGDGTVTASIAGAIATDLADNDNAASTSTDNEVTYDATNPTVTIDQAATQDDPANASPIVFDVVFDEDVTGFDETGVGIGGTAGATTALVTPLTATTYTVEISGMTGDGTVTATIAADAASDAAGNGNDIGTSTDNEVTYDATNPTVTVEQGATQDDTTNASPIVFDVVFTEAVTDFAAADVILSGSAGATTAVVTPVTAATYTVSVSGMTGDGTVIVDVPTDSAFDAATNGNVASTSIDNVVTYVAGDPTPGVNDPPSVTAPATAASELAAARPFTGADSVSVTDPDAVDAAIVVTLTADDAATVISIATTTGLVVTGNNSAAVSLTGSQSDINVALATLTVTANNVGTVTVTVAADDQGNTDGGSLTDSAAIVITVTDTTAPTLTVPAGGVTAAAELGKAGATVTFVVSVADPGSEPFVPPIPLAELQAAPTVSCSPASGAFFPIGQTNVSCTAVDASGNTTVKSFAVTVTDGQKPVISGANNQTFTLAVGTSGPVTYTAPTATDNSGSATITCTPASGATMSTGVNTITCTAADPSGNTATATFTVAVNATRIPDTGGTLTMVPWALALLALGSLLLAAVGFNRRLPTGR